MAIKFVYRIDDIHPAMMWDRFEEMMTLFELHHVVPLLGIIPDNRDQTLNFDAPDPNFFRKIKDMVDLGKVEICQHGYQHVYATKQKSVNQILYGRVSNSEFVGIPYEKQYQMIRKGKEILESNGLFTETWMAPSHTNDRNTFRALKKLGFKYVTDGIALYPYQQYGLIFVPQQIWNPKREFAFGLYTICLHLNDLSDESIREIKKHLKSGDEIISFSEAAQTPRRWFHKGLNVLYKMKRILSYRGVRYIRNIKRTLADD